MMYLQRRSHFNHPTTCCSAAELIAALFFAEMRYDPGQLQNPHSDRFVLVDGGGRIRGYYAGMDSRELVRLVADLRNVAEEPEA